MNKSRFTFKLMKNWIKDNISDYYAIYLVYSLYIFCELKFCWVHLGTFQDILKQF